MTSWATTMRRARSLALLAGMVWLLLAPLASYAAEEEEEEELKSDAGPEIRALSDGCGVYAAAIMLRRAGHRTTYDALARIADADGDGVSTIEGVVRCLQECGMPEARAYKASRADIPALPCILRLTEDLYENRCGHFVYVEPTEREDWFLVFYPPLGVYSMEKSRLVEHWDRSVLLEAAARETGATPAWIGLALLVVALLLFLTIRQGRQRTKVAALES